MNCQLITRNHGFRIIDERESGPCSHDCGWHGLIPSMPHSHWTFVMYLMLRVRILGARGHCIEPSLPTWLCLEEVGTVSVMVFFSWAQQIIGFCGREAFNVSSKLLKSWLGLIISQYSSRESFFKIYYIDSVKWFCIAQDYGTIGPIICIMDLKFLNSV